MAVRHQIARIFQMGAPYITITPLGGVGEIGLNCQKWECENGVILLDCGLMFPDDNQLGVDAVIPSFETLSDDKERILGMMLTHGHEDHIGALPWFVQKFRSVKLFGSPFTLGLVRKKLEERELMQNAELCPLAPYDLIFLGGLTFKAIPVCHSIPGGYAFGIETPVGTIVHTGDFKLDPSPVDGACNFLRDLRAFAGDSGVRLLMSDSTNIEIEGHSRSESDVRDSLDAIFAGASGRIVIALFASHIHRIRTVLSLAAKYRRKVVISGRSLATNMDIASRMGILEMPETVYADELPEDPGENTVVLVTGTQGEALSALSRIAQGEHRRLALHQGDIVIMSSRVIPGNARAVSRLFDKIYRSGAMVFHDSKKTVHATGHACRDELRGVIEAARPEIFIPVHGEYRHLVQHADLAGECGAGQCFILEDGQPVTLTADSVIIGERQPIDSVLVDGKGVGDVGRSVLRDRKILANEGIVIVSLLVDEVSGELLKTPDIISRGFVFEKEYSHILDDAKCVAVDQFENARPGDAASKLKDAIRMALRRFFRDIMGRDPIIETIITFI